MLCHKQSFCSALDCLVQSPFAFNLFPSNPTILLTTKRTRELAEAVGEEGVPDPKQPKAGDDSAAIDTDAEAAALLAEAEAADASNLDLQQTALNAVSCRLISDQSVSNTTESPGRGVSLLVWLSKTTGASESMYKGMESVVTESFLFPRESFV